MPVQAVGALRDFGRKVDCPDPVVEVETGGFISTGPASLPRPVSREEVKANDEGQDTRAEEARPQARSWPGQRASAPTCSPAEALGHRLTGALRLDELVHNYPDSSVVHCSSRLAILRIAVGVFRWLPFDTDLFLEVPLDGPLSLPGSGPYGVAVASQTAYVPDVRGWAVWRNGILPRPFHGYPDGSMCIHMPWDWIWGRDPLHTLVDWCVVWLGKALHLELLGYWPGPHHCSARVRVAINKPESWCGCGGPESRRWLDCHMASDLARPMHDLLIEEQHGRAAYLVALQRYGQDPRPPWSRGEFA